MNRQQLDRKAWKLFSRVVRLSAADHNGFCNCFTCFASKHWKDIDAGHWIGRGKKATKYHLENVRCQCKQCNKWGSPKLSKTRGEPVEFERQLKLLGVDTDELKRLANKNNNVPSLPDFEEFVESLRESLKYHVELAYKRGVHDARDALKL